MADPLGEMHLVAFSASGKSGNSERPGAMVLGTYGLAVDVALDLLYGAISAPAALAGHIHSETFA